MKCEALASPEPPGDLERPHDILILFLNPVDYIANCVDFLRALLYTYLWRYRDAV